jgi:hypothetical protein
MADAVSAVTQLDGDKKLITTYTNISDSTGDATRTLVDVSGLNKSHGNTGNSCSRVRLNKIWYNVSVTAKVDAVRLYWNATSNVAFLTLEGRGFLDFSSIGGIKNTEASGADGDVILTLPAVTSGDTASVHCEWIKVYS